MTLEVRLVDFRCGLADGVEREQACEVARFAASFELEGHGAVIVPGWQLVRVGPERYCLNTPKVNGSDHQKQVLVPQGWTMRLLARAIWRYKAETDPAAV